MRFPNAHKGVKNLFIAELIQIGALIVTLVSTVLAALATRLIPPNEGMNALSGTLVLIAGIVTAILVIVYYGKATKMLGK